MLRFSACRPRPQGGGGSDQSLHLLGADGRLRQHKYGPDTNDCDECDNWACFSKKKGGKKDCICDSKSTFDINKLPTGVKRHAVAAREYSAANPGKTLKGVKFSRKPDQPKPRNMMLLDHVPEGLELNEFEDWPHECAGSCHGDGVSLTMLTADELQAESDTELADENHGAEPTLAVLTQPTAVTDVLEPAPAPASSSAPVALNLTNDAAAIKQAATHQSMAATNADMDNLDLDLVDPATVLATGSDRVDQSIGGSVRKALNFTTPVSNGRMTNGQISLTAPMPALTMPSLADTPSVKSSSSKPKTTVTELLASAVLLSEQQRNREAARVRRTASSFVAGAASKLNAALGIIIEYGLQLTPRVWLITLVSARALLPYIGPIVQKGLNKILEILLRRVIAFATGGAASITHRLRSLLSLALTALLSYLHRSDGSAPAAAAQTILSANSVVQMPPATPTLHMLNEAGPSGGDLGADDDSSHGGRKRRASTPAEQEAIESLLDMGAIDQAYLDAVKAITAEPGVVITSNCMLQLLSAAGITCAQ